MRRNLKSLALPVLLSALFAASMAGCSGEGNSVTAEKDELAAYLEEHPELVEDAMKQEQQWEDGYVEPDGETGQK